VEKVQAVEVELDCVKQDFTQAEQDPAQQVLQQRSCTCLQKLRSCKTRTSCCCSSKQVCGPTLCMAPIVSYARLTRAVVNAWPLLPSTRLTRAVVNAWPSHPWTANSHNLLAKLDIAPDQALLLSKAAFKTQLQDKLAELTVSAWEPTQQTGVVRRYTDAFGAADVLSVNEVYITRQPRIWWCWATWGWGSMRSSAPSCGWRLCLCAGWGGRGATGRQWRRWRSGGCAPAASRALRRLLTLCLIAASMQLGGLS
jgi:hypothetical protein